MSKDSEKITQLTGLKIIYDGPQSTFTVPNMTTAQRDKLVNTDDLAHPVANGTIIFNTSVPALQCKVGNVWEKIAPLKGGNVIGTAETTANQLAIYTDDSGLIIEGAVNQSSSPVSIENVSLPVLQINGLPTLTGLTGTQLIDFVDLGCLTVNGKQFVTLNRDAGSGNHNILLTDDQTDATPTTYDAVVEIRSSKGGLLLPRLTTDQMNSMASPVPGMLIHNIDEDRAYSYSNTHGFITTGGLNHDNVSTSSGIIVWGNDSGSELIDTGVTIDPDSKSITFPESGKVKFTANDFTYSLSAAAALASNLNLIFPAAAPVSGQVLTAADNLGNTKWATPDDDPTFETITCTKDGSSLKGTHIDGTLTATNVDAHLITCSGIIATQNISVDSILTTQSLDAHSIACEGVISTQDISVDNILIAANSDIQTMFCTKTFTGKDVVVNGTLTAKSTEIEGEIDVSGNIVGGTLRAAGITIAARNAIPNPIAGTIVYTTDNGGALNIYHNGGWNVITMTAA